MDNKPAPQARVRHTFIPFMIKAKVIIRTVDTHAQPAKYSESGAKRHSLTSCEQEKARETVGNGGFWRLLRDYLN